MKIRSLQIREFIVCAAVLIAIAGTALVSPKPTRAESWSPAIGETIVYDMKMFRMTLAKQTVKVEELTNIDGEPCLRLTSSSRSTSLAKRFMSIDDVNESCVDPETLTPIAYKSRIRESGWSADINIKFGKNDIVVDEIRGEKLDEKRHTDVKGGRGVLDDVSIMFNLRGKVMKVGDKFTVQVLSDRAIETAKISVERMEEIKTPLGKKKAFVVTSTFSESIFWIEDSPERVPLRFEVKTKAGRANGFIKSYTKGK